MKTCRRPVEIDKTLVAREIKRIASLVVNVTSDAGEPVDDVYGDIVDTFQDRVESSGMAGDGSEAGVVLTAASTGLGLNGMKKTQATKLVNSIVAPLAKGMFRDNSWKPIHAMFRALEEAHIDCVVTKTEYIKDDRDVPTSKRWAVEIEFTDDNGRPKKLYGTIVASGAGSVADPLEKYDVVVYFS